MVPLLEAKGIRKVYPGGTLANDDVSLTIHAGEVHAVVGENGAGKSTLMKVLFGIEQPTSGSLLLNGKPVVFQSPRAAIDAGVGMVFQHFSLVPSFRVYENVVLGAEPKHGLRFDRTGAIAKVQALSERFRLHVDPLSPVETLPVGQQQRVEILKALYSDARILILDEPTAVLAPQEVDELFVAVRALAAQGRAVIFIAHKLPEVLEISDRITVMRAGRTVGQVATKDVTKDSLATMMVGREVALRVNRAATDQSNRACVVSDLTVLNDRGVEGCSSVTFNIHSGEILGMAGVEGNGQEIVLDAISGLRPLVAGSITLNGTDLAPLSVLDRRLAGLANIPQDRLATGLAPGASVADNMVSTRLKNPAFVKRGLLDLKAIARMARGLIDKYTIRAAGPDAAAASLSGGNMQKVVVARELSEKPAMLLVSQPTRGVDLGATQFIWQSITDARDQGTAVLLSSADLSELLALSDRLVVFYHGQIVAAFHNHPDLSPETLGTYMLGLKRQTLEEMQAVLT